MRPNQEVETFPDGIVEIYAEDGRAIGKTPKARFHFENQSVGVRRYYEAQASVTTNRIDRVIKVPHTGIAEALNIAIISSEGDKQYRILRIQHKPERNVDLWELQSVKVKVRNDG